MDPELDPEEYVFCALPEAGDIDAIGVFREREGVTVICRRAEADLRDLPFAFPSRRITLNVQSSLEAVGLLAAVTAELARAGIAVNVISAFYHDHLFVAAADAERTVLLIRGMQHSARI